MQTRFYDVIIVIASCVIFSRLHIIREVVLLCNII